MKRFCVALLAFWVLAGVCQLQATPILEYDITSTYSFSNLVYFDVATNTQGKLNPGTSGYYAPPATGAHNIQDLVRENTTTGAANLQFNFANPGQLEHAWLDLYQSGIVTSPDWQIIGTNQTGYTPDWGFEASGVFILTSGAATLTVSGDTVAVDLMTDPDSIAAGIAAALLGGGTLTVQWRETFHYDLDTPLHNGNTNCEHRCLDTWQSTASISGNLVGTLAFEGPESGVPEPAALVLAGAGLALLAIFRRRLR